MLVYSREKTREGRVGGLPKPERAVRAESPACTESPAGVEELTSVGEIAGASEY